MQQILKKALLDDTHEMVFISQPATLFSNLKDFQMLPSINLLEMVNKLIP